jgi:phosphoserine phosphatase RsbU/P
MSQKTIAPALTAKASRRPPILASTDDDLASAGGAIACIVPQVEPSLDDHIQQLQDKISQLSFELNLLRRRDEHVSTALTKLDEEQRLAARLQQDFLPKRMPQVGQVHFQTLFRPASYVSGDLYDVMRLDEHHVGFYVADAVGHGMPAALLTMFMKNALVTKDIGGPAGYRVLDPSETMSRLNNSLCEQNLSNATFATAVYGTLNTQTLMLSVARGGHPNPILIRDGQMLDLEADGALLGIFPDEAFATCAVQLQRGDRVLVYTDGIEVAFSGDSDAADTERWRSELRERAREPIAVILEDFASRLDSAGGSLLPKDDLTIVAMEVR